MLKIFYKINFSFLFIILLFFGTQTSFSQKEDVIVVTVKEGQSIRDIAQEYLKDPNLWEEILKENKLNSPADVVAGMKLTIPVGKILKAKKKLDEASIAIQRATDAGAKLFATKTIANAITLYNQSIDERKKGNWESSFNFAVQSEQMAIQALNEANSNRTTTEDANLSYKKGNVESRPANANSWNELKLYDKLFEQDRIRTLSNAFAEITFQDMSKIRLNDNSQAVIQKTRVDLLKNKKESSVTLEKGDAYALLQGNQKKKKFNLEIPGVKTDINSKNFYVKKDESSSKIANYDGEIAVSSGGKTVVVKENEGSTIVKGGKPTDPKPLLSAPGLQLPLNEATIYNSVQFVWSKNDTAKAFRINVSEDPSFKKIVLNKIITGANVLNSSELNSGKYYWRVASIDKQDLPGIFSSNSFFTFIIDKTAPYLAILQPEENQIITESEFVIAGKSESEVLLIINQQVVNVWKDGSFSHKISLVEGENTIQFKAEDKAGNISELSRKVKFVANDKIEINFDENIPKMNDKFISNGTTLVLSGKTKSNASIVFTIEGEKNSFSTFSNAQGIFSINLPVKNEERSVEVLVTTNAGYKFSTQIKIMLYDKFPNIVITEEPPAFTKNEAVVIKGKLQNTKSGTLNEVPLQMTNNEFAVSLKLNEGANEVWIYAVDEFNNVAKIFRKIVRDTQPPKLISQKINMGGTQGNETFSLTIAASDESSLKNICRVNVLIGSDIRSFQVKLNDVTKNYERTFNVQLKTGEKVILKSILLEDYLGNYKDYRLE